MAEALGVRVPVAVELFTSQTCPNCPPADALLARLHREQPLPGVEVIVLGEHVDYGGRREWRDPFAADIFNQRQRRYSRGRPMGVYTPQIVVDGWTVLPGPDKELLRDAIAEAARAPKVEVRLRIGEIADGRLWIAADVMRPPSDAAEVWLAIAEDDLTSTIPEGANRGKTVDYVAVVRTLVKAGDVPAAGRPAALQALFELEGAWREERLRAVALLQDSATGRVLGATAAALLPQDSERGQSASRSVLPPSGL